MLVFGVLLAVVTFGGVLIFGGGSGSAQPAPITTAALGKVVEKTKGPLADEFHRALSEIRVGKARKDSLRDIITRANVPALTSFVGAIIQAEQLGVSISKVLPVQSEQLRIERRQRAEEAAAKAPIKMLFPLVGCIFPSMFIVILGPAIILIMANMGSGAL